MEKGNGKDGDGEDKRERRKGKDGR